MIAFEAIRNSTPSLTVILVFDATVRSPSNRYGLHVSSRINQELIVPVGTVEAMKVCEVDC